MSINLEEQLAAGMREHISDLAVDGGAVLGRATRRHRRRTAVIRTAYALGVAGLAGVLAVGLTAGGGSGRPGQGNNRDGAAGEDLELHVPDGTVVLGEDGELLTDLVGQGTRLVAAAGGRGGLGNAALAPRRPCRRS